MQVKDEDNDLPIHLAADYGYHKYDKLIIIKNTLCVLTAIVIVVRTAYFMHNSILFHVKADEYNIQ